LPIQQQRLSILYRFDVRFVDAHHALRLPHGKDKEVVSRLHEQPSKGGEREGQDDMKCCPGKRSRGRCGNILPGSCEIAYNAGL
jgi:hypothetical protein